MILSKAKKIPNIANHKMKISIKNKIKIIYQDHNRKNIRNIWINFTKTKRKIRPTLIN